MYSRLDSVRPFLVCLITDKKDCLIMYRCSCYCAYPLYIWYQWKYKLLFQLTFLSHEQWTSLLPFIRTHCTQKGLVLRSEPKIPVRDAKVKDKLVHLKSLSLHLMPSVGLSFFFFFKSQQQMPLNVFRMIVRIQTRGFFDHFIYINVLKYIYLHFYSHLYFLNSVLLVNNLIKII